MATSSGKKKYPQLMYAEGKAPSQRRSMNYNSYVSNLKMVEIGVGKDVWDSLKESSIGVIAKLKDVEYMFAAKVVHYLLTHQLQTKRNYEIWSLVDTQPIRLSLLEFGYITGLNCEPFEEEKKWDLDHKEFWGELNVSTLEGPSLDQLCLVFSKSTDWSFEKRRMIGLLCLLSIGICGISPSTHIPLHLAKRVLNREAFESYPWGRVACKSLMVSIKTLCYGAKKTYTLSGCVHVLLIWAYEAIAGIGELYGNKRAGEEVPLLSWGGSRPRIKWTDFFREEKKNHDKIRVRNFISQLDGETSAKWADEEEDENVKTMLDDIHCNRLDESAWDVIDAPNSKKIKRKETVQHSDDDFNGPEKPTRMKKKEKKPERISESQLAAVEQTNILDIMKTFTAKVDNMETSIANKVLAGLDGAIDAKVEVRLIPVAEKIATLEKEVQYLKERLGECDTKEAANSNVNISHEVTSNAMSWMVQTKATSHDDLPIHVVVKNAYKQCKKTEKLNGKQTEDRLHKKKDLKGKLLQNIVTDQKMKIKQEAASSETWSNPARRRLGAGLDAMLTGICALEDHTPLPKRQTKLASTQLFPFVGNSTVKRIIAGVTPSVAAYDPMAIVDETKANNLMDFLRHNVGDDPIITLDINIGFYIKLISPRDQWPMGNYGWLNTDHMCSAMHMFYKRSLREPSPFHSPRIAFIDQWFVNEMVNDYKLRPFDPKTWVVPEKYKRVFNGKYPPDSVTNKRWLHDVDNLYACHHINGNHWVALDIDLVKERIHVYDSILSVVPDDKEIKEMCRPFTRMIPALLSAMVPCAVRKKSDKQFTVKRLKNVPQNLNPGDCGVYTLKYIECLAIGCTSDGLTDRNIPALRLRLAAELYDEVREPRITKSTQLVREDNFLKPLQLIDSL